MNVPELHMAIIQPRMPLCYRHAMRSVPVILSRSTTTLWHAHIFDTAPPGTARGVISLKTLDAAINDRIAGLEHANRLQVSARGNAFHELGIRTAVRQLSCQAIQ